MRYGWAVIAVGIALCLAPLSQAQESLSAKLLADALGTVRSGAYLAGDTVKFTLDEYGNRFLLRVANDPEVYVLYANRASLGGRELKDDTGATAISVAGWGGMTLYTESNPNGLPAVRTGDSAQPTLSAVSLPDMQNAAQDEQQHLIYSHKLKIAVVIDWNEVANNAASRALAFEAMENAVRGIDRFSRGQQGRSALGARIDTLRLSDRGSPPLAWISGRALVVTYNPNQGFAGRASSRAITRALGLLLGVRSGG